MGFGERDDWLPGWLIVRGWALIECSAHFAVGEELLDWIVRARCVEQLGELGEVHVENDDANDVAGRELFPFVVEAVLKNECVDEAFDPPRIACTPLDHQRSELGIAE